MVHGDERWLAACADILRERDAVVLKVTASGKNLLFKKLKVTASKLPIREGIFGIYNNNECQVLMPTPGKINKKLITCKVKFCGRSMSRSSV